jgi:hypothetical protein
MKRIALVAVAVPMLALATACSPSADTKSAADQKPAATRTTAPAGKKDAPPEPGITADKLADYQKVAACMKQQGVTVPEPVVGKPFDDTEMNRLFSEDKDKWNAVLANCDYKKVVIGVG